MDAAVKALCSALSEINSAIQLFLLRQYTGLLRHHGLH